MVGYTFHASTWKRQAGETLQGQPGLCSKFHASQSSVVRPCLEQDDTVVKHRVTMTQAFSSYDKTDLPTT